MISPYQALREQAASIDLSARGRIKVSGDDRARLLHAMTTNHIQALVPGAGCYAFFLNAQGRILADANILCFEDHFLIDTEPQSRMFLMEHLDRYIIADDVTLEDQTETSYCQGIEGPEALVSWSNLDAPLKHVSKGSQTVVRASCTGAPGIRIFSAEPLGGSLPMAAPEDVESVRLEHFFPRFPADINNGHLAQETAVTDALSFSKGCYLGQEIVERVRSRGHVNRMLVGLVIDGIEPLPSPAKVAFEDAECGDVTSSSLSPALGSTVALAYARIPASKPGTHVLVAGRQAQVRAIKSSRT